MAAVAYPEISPTLTWLLGLSELPGAVEPQSSVIAGGHRPDVDVCSDVAVSAELAPDEWRRLQGVR